MLFKVLGDVDERVYMTNIRAIHFYQYIWGYFMK